MTCLCIAHIKYLHKNNNSSDNGIVKCIKHTKTQFRNNSSKETKIEMPRISLNIRILTEASGLKLLTKLCLECQAEVQSGAKTISYLMINIPSFENQGIL